MNVDIRGVTRRFGRNLAVAGVDLETGPGVFGLLGPNGAGKTTLLRMLATVITPSAGSCGCSAVTRAATGRGGRSGAGSGTCRRTSATTRGSPWRSSSSTSHCSRRCRRPGPRRRGGCGRAGGPRRQGQGEAAHPVRRDAAPGRDRAGDRQRPGAAAAGRADRRAGPRAAGRVPALLRGLGERATVVVSTHLVEDVGAACSEVALMDAGKIVFHGTPAELTARGEGTRAAGTPRWSAATALSWRRHGHDPRRRSRSGPDGPRPGAWRPCAAAGRLLRLELKRNVVPYVLPLLAAVFYFDTVPHRGRVPARLDACARR